jgi:putative nucleotidyltransferase with HDIG domain
VSEIPDELRATNRREAQLDTISSLLTVAMGIVVALLLFVLSSRGVDLGLGVPLAGYTDRVLLGAFVLLVVIYLWEQRRRLRQQVDAAFDQTQRARAELEATCRYLEFSHSAASQLCAEGVGETMRGVLENAAVLFKADAAAVLGEDDEYVYVAEEHSREAAERALLHAEAMAAGKEYPFYSESSGADTGHAIAVPLRSSGDLRYVLALWKSAGEFGSDQLEALALMGRMVELALEREDSLKEVNNQVQGTLRVLEYMVADKRPDYSRHSQRVAGLADAVGKRVGLSAVQRRDLRVAGLLHDVGLMTLRDGLPDAGDAMTPEEVQVVRKHPMMGGEIAVAANFGPAVREAIEAHHERVDGMGYPLGLKGSHIPLSARVLAVCEAHDSMTNRSYHGSGAEGADAMAVLRREAGTVYDPQVVLALEDVLADEVRAEHDRRASGPAVTSQ